MIEKFTPGPWEVLNAEFTNDGVNYEISMPGHVINTADVPLIEAAPDLYDALNRIYNKLLISDRDGESHISEKDGEMALVALRKARGEA